MYFRTSGKKNKCSPQTRAAKNYSAFFKPAFVQTKLSINQPDDIYEHEADSVAEQVMRMPDRNENHFFSSRNPGKERVPINSVQRKSDCDEEKLHRKVKNSNAVESNNSFQNYASGLSSGGSKLPVNVRSFFEPRFGYDFSNVIIHNDSSAVKSAQSINSIAYTLGNNIVFNENQYSPDTDGGKKLLAHELTHVVQQKSGAEKKIMPKQSDRHYTEDSSYYLGMKGDEMCEIYRCKEGDSVNACGDHGYYLGYVNKYCKKFTQLKPNISPSGKKWI